MSSCERRSNSRNAHAQLPSWVVRVNARETIRTAPPSGWHQSRGYARRRLKQLQQQLKTPAKHQTPQRFGRVPTPDGADTKKQKKRGNTKPYKLTVA